MAGKFERGREVTRIEAFVDAAFAFAVTLLVTGTLVALAARLYPNVIQ